jgi:putative Mg2+ transporter-C (MgtC) family protein
MEAILATAFIIAANTLLRPLVNMMDLQPLDAESEVTHVIYLIAIRIIEKW